jgi:secreted protein with Ig-like and vWFA domain
MTDSNTPREDWEDRLIDRLLQEKLGSDSPPDLSQKILDAVTTDSCPTPIFDADASLRDIRPREAALPCCVGSHLKQQKGNGMRTAKTKWIDRFVTASATCIVTVIIVALVIPLIYGNRQAANNFSQQQVMLEIENLELQQEIIRREQSDFASVTGNVELPGLPELVYRTTTHYPVADYVMPTTPQGMGGMGGMNGMMGGMRGGMGGSPPGPRIQAESAALEVQWMDPDHHAAQQGVNTARQTRHLLDELNLRDDRQRGVLDVLMSVQRSHVPLSDEPPYLYPDAEVWQQLPAYRLEHYGSVDLSSSSENEQKILEALDNETSVDADGTPLTDVISDWKIEQGIEIQFDEAALRDIGVDPELEKIDRKVSGISFRSALRLILEERGLTYTIQNEVLLVTSIEKAQKYIITKTHPPVVPTLGQGPGMGGDQYTRIIDNPFHATIDAPLSTFSIDVDTAAYANVRRFLLAENRLPHPDAVRIEEMINYFDYDYEGPDGDIVGGESAFHGHAAPQDPNSHSGLSRHQKIPFASHIEAVACPWNPDHRLVRVALKGYEVEVDERPDSNLVFLLDVSGSMSSEDKLPLLKTGMKLLARQLGKTDRVAIVVYAGSEGLVLESTSGKKRNVIIEALDRLESGGSTNGGAGIELAYDIAQENFIEEGVNRVILCTDGDFNVGTTDNAALERMAEEKAETGVFLSVLGFGRGNLNDSMMEKISNCGNGNYAYIDTVREAQKVLVEQMGATLVTIAKDVKIQIEFNPRQVAGYRLIGYANRLLAPEDFNDDTKDAGEIGAGHAVTALYEVVPAGEIVETPPIDPLKYQIPTALSGADESFAEELLTLKIRYKQPDGDVSTKLEFPLIDDGEGFAKASPDLKFAAAVASFGMLLRDSHYKGDATYEAVLEIATEGLGDDSHEYRAEFLDMVRAAIELTPVPVVEETTEEETPPADPFANGAAEEETPSAMR